MVGGNPAARTRLEQRVRQSRRTVQEFCEDFHALSRELGESTVVSERQVSRWMGGQLGGLPHPATCRVLERMLGEAAESLFGPPLDTLPAQQRTDVASAFSGPDSDNDVHVSIESEVAMAAAESARFGQFSEQSNVGPHTLGQFHADVSRIVTTYPNRPVYPLFVELRELRNRVFGLLEGRQHPGQTRELYRVAAIVCGAMANASFDLGWLPAAETQARTAFLCAELAGNNALRCWIRGTQSLIAYWDDRPKDTVELASDGWHYIPETGTARVRLAAIEARAQARLRDKRATENALERVVQAREEVSGDDQPGGLLAFPVAKQTFYSATARLWLGDHASLVKAEQAAAEAVELYQEDPPEHRRIGELSLARLDLALARLSQENLEGAAAEVQDVLAIVSRRRTDSVIRRFRQLSSALQRPHFQATVLAADLRDQILSFCETSPAPELPEQVR